jgi:hypothetical protein
MTQDWSYRNGMGRSILKRIWMLLTRIPVSDFFRNSWPWLWRGTDCLYGTKGQLPSYFHTRIIRFPERISYYGRTYVLED